MTLSTAIRTWMAAAIATALIVLAGCGGGGGGSATAASGGTTGSSSTTTGTTTSSTTGTTTGTTLTQALNILSTYTNASIVPSTTDIANLGQTFDALRTATPTATDAQVGFAVTQAAVVANKLSALFPASATDSDFQNFDAPVYDMVLGMRLGDQVSGKVLPSVVLIDSPKLIRVVPFLGQTLRQNTTDPKPWQIAKILSDSQASIDSAIAALKAVSDSAPPTAMSKAGTPATTVNYGSVERRSLLARLQLMSALGRILNAYQMQPLSSVDNNALQSFATYFQNSSVLSPSNYLPADPWLTLASDATTKLQAAQQLWQDSADSATSGLTQLKSRTGTGWVLNPGAVSSSVIDQAISDDATFKTAITTPITTQIELATNVETETINLSRLITNPPADLKVFFPGIQLSILDPSVNQGSIDFDSNSIIDFTWGGIFQDPLLADSYFNRSDTVTDQWTVGDIITFALNIFG